VNSEAMQSAAPNKDAKRPEANHADSQKLRDVTERRFRQRRGKEHKEMPAEI
jgi:hypothetical protein